MQSPVRLTMARVRSCLGNLQRRPCFPSSVTPNNHVTCQSAQLHVHTQLKTAVEEAVPDSMQHRYGVQHNVRQRDQCGVQHNLRHRDQWQSPQRPLHAPCQVPSVTATQLQPTSQWQGRPLAPAPLPGCRRFGAPHWPLIPLQEADDLEHMHVHSSRFVGVGGHVCWGDSLGIYRR